MYSLWIFSDWLLYIGQNKPLFLQLGVVDVGLSLLMQSTQAHVQVKALSLLRLLAENQGITRALKSNPAACSVAVSIACSVSM